MTITIKLKTDNEAFDSKALEITRIVGNWLAGTSFTRGSTTLRDSNGNTVGSVTVAGK